MQDGKQSGAAGNYGAPQQQYYAQGYANPNQSDGYAYDSAAADPNQQYYAQAQQPQQAYASNQGEYAQYGGQQAPQQQGQGQGQGQYYGQQPQYDTQAQQAPPQQQQQQYDASGGDAYQQQAQYNEQTGQWEYPQQAQGYGQQNGGAAAAPAPQGYAAPQPGGYQQQREPAKPKKEERIDPAQIPRWSPEHKTDEPIQKYYTRSGSSPPPSTHPFIAVDEGNCSPRYIRMSTNYIANENDLVEQTKLCIGAIIQPLAEQAPAEEPPPLRDFGKEGPIRCKECRAYVNPFFRFVDNGRSFICNMCETSNSVPDSYFCNLDPQGIRRDKNDRPELCKGSVDIVAPPDYCDTAVTDPCYLFVVDTSYSSQVNGLLDCALDCIRMCVEELSANPRVRVGIMTYDKSLYFYNVKQAAPSSEKAEGKEEKEGKEEPSAAGEPQLHVLSDVDDAFVPVLPESILLPLSDEQSTETVLRVIDLIGKVNSREEQEQQQQQVGPNGYPIQSTRANLPPDNCAFGAAMQAGALLLEKFGGKLIGILSKLPDVGAGTLQNRNDIKLYHTDKERTLLVPNGAFYEKLSTFCAQSRVSVDLFACASSYLDLATIGALSRTTGGQIYYYNGFHAHKDGEAFHRDMYRNITRYTAFEGLMVIRASKGLRVAERYGNFFAREAEEMEIPVINCDSSFGIMLSHESKVTTKEAAIQTALLYTTPEGQRRIRIHTISLPVTSALCNLFRHADLDTIINLSLKQAVNQLLYKVTPVNARKALAQACIDSLFVYRKYCSTQHSPGQLILPEPLKLLPLATLGMIKHNLFHQGEQMDERAFLTSFVLAMPTYVACSFVDPCLFSLTEIPDYASVEGQDGRVFLPPVLKLSSDSIRSDGIYLLDDGRSLYIWIGDNVPGEITSQLFQQVQYSEGGPMHVQLSYDENADPMSLNSKVWTLIVQLRKNCPSFKTINIVTRNTHTGASLDESQFFDHLIEDAARKDKWHTSDVGSKKDDMCTVSYIDFLCLIHKRIQEKFYPN